MQEDLFSRIWFHPFETYWNTAQRHGYSGVATLISPRIDLLSFETFHNAASIVGWNLERWAYGKSRNWEDELRSIDVIANRSVDLFAFDTSREIQYTVFGNRHILLQEQDLLKSDLHGVRGRAL